jgi:hypothetical protein
MNKFLQDYIECGFDSVQGWCGHKLFEVVDLLNSVEINKQGGCLEIGVHHGKFYILLNSVIEATHKSYALDVFDNQHLNIDGSGKGSLDAFKNNLTTYDRHKGANSKIVTGDSTDPLIIESFDEADVPFRFISIDGGHTAEHTVSDLNLANKLIANQGVVILDDILNYHWLGVIEGAVSFLNMKPTLVPFAIGHNKLLFAKLSYKSFYFNIFDKSPLKSKVVDFFGHSIVAL